MDFLNILKYFALVLLGILSPILIIWRVVRLVVIRIKNIIHKWYIEILKRIQALLKIRFKSPETEGISLKQEWIRSIDRIDKNISSDLLNWFSGVIFVLLMMMQIVAEDWLKNVISGNVALSYIIMFWLLYGFTYWSHSYGKMSENVWATTILTLVSLTLFLPTWMVLLFALLRSMDFGLVVIAALFCFLPSYYLTMTMLNLVKNSLLRILVATVFIAIVGSYTLMVFGTYDIKVDGLIENYKCYGFIEYSSKAIYYGLKQIAQSSLTDMKGERIDQLLQVSIGIYGGLVITYVTKVALSDEKNKI